MFIFTTLLKHVRILFLCILLTLSFGVLIGILYEGSYETRASFNILSSESYDPYLIFTSKDASKNYFGGKEEIARTLGILKSKSFFNQIITKENLAPHYGYDTSKSGKSKTFKDFGDRLRLNLNKDEGLITIKFNDNDPKVSFKILNSIIQELENQLADEISTKNIEILKTLEENYATRIKRSDSMYQVVKRLRIKFGIIDTKSQGEFLSKLSITKPNDIQIQKYINGIDSLQFLENILESESKIQSFENDKIINLKKSIVKPFKAILLAERPYLAEEKSKPSLLIISAISLFIGLTIALLIIFIKVFLSKSNQDNV